MCFSFAHAITVLKKVVEQPKSEITCEFCKYAVTFLDNQLKSDRSEEKIKQVLQDLCAYLPSSVSGQVLAVSLPFLFIMSIQSNSLRHSMILN